MQKNYLSKLGIITSIFGNCSLPETNQQLSDEKFISLKKDLKKLLSQNVLNNGHHQRQIHGMQNSIQNLKNDVSNLTQLLNSQKYVNDLLLQNIKTIKTQVDELKTLPDTVKGIQEQVDTLKQDLQTEFADKQDHLDECFTKSIKCLHDCLDERMISLEKSMKENMKKPKESKREKVKEFFHSTIDKKKK